MNRYAIFVGLSTELGLLIATHLFLTVLLGGLGERRLFNQVYVCGPTTNFLDHVSWKLRNMMNGFMCIFSSKPATAGAVSVDYEHGWDVKPNTHLRCRHDSSVELSRVGGVYRNTEFAISWRQS